jgi:hypothetical protein
MTAPLTGITAPTGLSAASFLAPVRGITAHTDGTVTWTTGTIHATVMPARFRDAAHSHSIISRATKLVMAKVTLEPQTMIPAGNILLDFLVGVIPAVNLVVASTVVANMVAVVVTTKPVE